MNRPARAIGGVLFAAAALAAGFLADHVLSRPDRVLHARRANDLLAVYDEILRYEHENLELPRTLGDLAPVYLRPEQIAAPDGAPLYAYDRAGRAVTLATGQAIRGLVRRTWPPARLSLPPPDAQPGARPIARADGLAVVPRGPAGAPRPAGALVFEAEHYTELTYGWEVHADPACGGGAYAYSKEGIANGPGQTRMGVYDFHNIHEKSEYTRIRWHIHVPVSGLYYICGRIWTTGSHCSNDIVVGIDGAGPGSDGETTGQSIGNRTPFRWRWESTEPVRIAAGDHFLEAFLHEDGVLVDQFALSPVPLQGDRVYAASVVPVDRDTAFRQAGGPPLALAFDLASMVMSTATNPVCNLTIRRLRPAEGQALVRVQLKGAATNGTDLVLGEYALDLGGREELLFLPVDFSRLDVAGLSRREYLLTAEVLRLRRTIAQAHIPLWRPFRWEVSATYPMLYNGEHGPLDGNAEPPAGAATNRAWRAFREANLDCFGVLDFGLQTIGNSLHAPQGVTIYARTEIVVPQAGEYLLKAATDDQMILWLDGRVLYRNEEFMPVSRSAERVKVQLPAGRHRLRMRVNNRESYDYADGRWQAVVRFRTLDDDLSDVRGASDW